MMTLGAASSVAWDLLGPGLFLGSCRAPAPKRMMDFENLFSKPPNPALGKKSTTNSDQR